MLDEIILTDLLDKLIADIQPIDIDGDIIRLEENMEKILEKVLKHKEIVEMIDKRIKNKISEEFKQRQGLKKVEGNKITVGYRQSKRRKISGKPSKEFILIEKKVNTKTVNEYFKITGKLPEGINESIFEYVTYKLC